MASTQHDQQRNGQTLYELFFAGFVWTIDSWFITDPTDPLGRGYWPLMKTEADAVQVASCITAQTGSNDVDPKCLDGDDETIFALAALTALERGCAGSAMLKG